MAEKQQEIKKVESNTSDLLSKIGSINMTDLKIDNDQQVLQALEKDLREPIMNIYSKNFGEMTNQNQPLMNILKFIEINVNKLVSTLNKFKGEDDSKFNPQRALYEKVLSKVKKNRKNLAIIKQNIVLKEIETRYVRLLFSAQNLLTKAFISNDLISFKSLIISIAVDHL